MLVHHTAFSQDPIFLSCAVEGDLADVRIPFVLVSHSDGVLLRDLLTGTATVVPAAAASGGAAQVTKVQQAEVILQLLHGDSNPWLDVFESVPWLVFSRAVAPLVHVVCVLVAAVRLRRWCRWSRREAHTVRPNRVPAAMLALIVRNGAPSQTTHAHLCISLLSFFLLRFIFPNRPVLV